MLLTAILSLALAEPLTVDQAVAEALAHAPEAEIAQQDRAIAEGVAADALAARRPTLSIEGHVHGGHPSAYASGDGRLQLIGRVPIVDREGRAGLRQARAEASAAEAAVPLVRADLELVVRDAVATLQAVQAEVDLRDQLVEDLSAYLAVVRARVRGGIPATDDLLRTQARTSQARAQLASARRSRDSARVALLVLLGRGPDGEVELVAQGAPPPVPEGGGPSDVQAAQRLEEVARAGLAVARAGRAPRIALEVDVGGQPVLGTSTAAPVNNGQGWGTEGILTFALPLRDGGATKARIARAEAEVRRAEAVTEQTRRRVDTERASAAAQLRGLESELGLYDDILPQARDGWLYALSVYRGGQGTALGVLDAREGLVQAQLDHVQTTFEAWLAWDRLHRWESE